MAKGQIWRFPHGSARVANKGEPRTESKGDQGNSATSRAIAHGHLALGADEVRFRLNSGGDANFSHAPTKFREFGVLGGFGSQMRRMRNRGRG